MVDAAEKPDWIVEVDSVDIYRGNRQVLRDVSVRIERGRVVALMGPSGVGKTTLLKVLTGQLLPDTGTVRVDGADVTKLKRRALKRLRREIGVLLQNSALFTDLDVFENVAVPLREHSRLPEPIVRRLVLLKLESVGLRGAAHLMPAQLSGGMARRVALARAVALDPKLVLYDEPLSGLDPIAVAVVERLIRQTNDALGLTSIIVTHNVEEMRDIADYCYLMIGGEIIAEGRPHELMQSTDPRVEQFMDGLPDGPVPFHYPSEHDLQEALVGEVS